MRAIAAMAENRVIGKDGNIPWHVREDFAWFKEFTTGKILIMGSSTFYKIPPLKNRNIIVLSSKKVNSNYDPTNNTGYVFKLFEDILLLDLHHKGQLVLAGGAKTYEQFLPYVTDFYVTYIKGNYEGDTLMPAFEHLFPKYEYVKTLENKHDVIHYTK